MAIKNIAVALLCLSVVLIGAPAPVHAHHHAHHHEHLAGNAAQHHKDCADHDKCCMGCSINLALLSDTSSPVPASTGKGQALQSAQTFLLSSLLQTQDRPPKHLS